MVIPLSFLTLLSSQSIGMLADKKDQFYNSVISLIRCRLSFSLLRSAIMCLRGSRSTAGHPLKEFDFVLAGTEGRLPLTD